MPVFTVRTAGMAGAELKCAKPTLAKRASRICAKTTLLRRPCAAATRRQRARCSGWQGRQPRCAGSLNCCQRSSSSTKGTQVKHCWTAWRRRFMRWSQLWSVWRCESGSLMWPPGACRLFSTFHASGESRTPAWHALLQLVTHLAASPVPPFMLKICWCNQKVQVVDVPALKPGTKRCSADLQQSPPDCMPMLGFGIVFCLPLPWDSPAGRVFTAALDLTDASQRDGTWFADCLGRCEMHYAIVWCDVFSTFKHSGTASLESIKCLQGHGEDCPASPVLSSGTLFTSVPARLPWCAGCWHPAGQALRCSAAQSRTPARCGLTARQARAARSAASPAAAEAALPAAASARVQPRCRQVRTKRNRHSQ